MYRFDVDYIDEEQGIKHIPCNDGDYVLAEDALELQATITEQADDLRGMEIIVKDLSDQLKQRDFQDEVLEETGRLLDKSQAKVEELTKIVERFTHCPDCGVDGSEHDPSCRAFEESE